MAPSVAKHQALRNQSRGRGEPPQAARQGHKPRGSNRTSNISFQNGQEFRTSTPQNAPAVKADSGMSPASRYSQNLRVLRRHDPSISSIFDQFSHVCLYHHDGEKWEKKGYEGGMFLFEREQEPRYGFFILNRMGTEDYIRCLVTTDEMSLNGPILILNTQRSDQRGRGEDDKEVLGFWIKDTTVREPMSAVMMRLLSYVKDGQSYPAEYRYGPERSAPMHFTASEDEVDRVDEDLASNTPAKPQKSVPAAGMSELDKLFAKLGPVPTNTVANAIPTTESDAQPGSLILNYLNGVGGGMQSTASKVDDCKLTGKDLLDTMFASVSTASVSSHAQTKPQHPQSAMANFRFPQSAAPSDLVDIQDGRHMFVDPEILSPKPSSAAPPQILNATSLRSLMGLPTDSSRSPSRTSTSASSQAQSSYNGRPRNGNKYSPSSSGAHRSRERGYIADRGEDDGGISEASTGIESDDQARVIHGPPLSKAPAAHTLISRPSFLSATSSGSASGSMLKGDATPRARSERLDSSLPSSPPHLSQGPPRRSTIGTLAPNDQSIMSVVDSAARKPQKFLQQRESAPTQTSFRSGADLWPHDDTRQSLHPQDVNQADSQAAVVELDFSEISVLNDPQALEARATGSASVSRGKERQITKTTKGKQTVPTSAPLVNGKGLHPRHEDAAIGSEGDRRSRNKDTKKVDKDNLLSQSAGKPTGPLPSSASSASSSQSASALVSPSSKNGSVHPPAVFSSDVARRIVLSEAMRSDLKWISGPALEKNAFIREILTLIHTDKSFTENLYQSYLNLVSK